MNLFYKLVIIYFLTVNIYWGLGVSSRKLRQNVIRQIVHIKNVLEIGKMIILTKAILCR